MKTGLHLSFRRNRVGLCGLRVRVVGAALCLVVAACNAVPGPLTAACTSASHYQGGPLRTPIRPADITLTPAGLSSLTAMEINRLEKAFDTVRTATGVETMTAAVLQGGGGAWMQQHGVQRAKLHYWASVGTLVTSAAIMRLAAEEDIFSGRIFPRNGLKQVFAKLYPMEDRGLWYGAGAMAYDVPGQDGTSLWFGHSGGVPGARAVVAYVPSPSAIVAVALTGNGSAEAVANLLLGAVARSP